MRFLGVALASGLVASSAGAFAFRVGQVPNGAAFTCSLCHVSPQGGGRRTLFGEDVRLTVVGVNVGWAAVCPLDSDGDGFTNGEELGDPTCAWMRGDVVEATPTNPNDPDEFPMGAGGEGGMAGEGGAAGEGVPDASAPDASAPDASLADVGLGGEGGTPDAGEGGSGGAAAAGGAPDAGPPADGEGGGGCQQAPGGAAPWLLMLGLLGGRRGPRRR